MFPLKKVFSIRKFLDDPFADQENYTVIDSSPNVKQDDSLLGLCISIDTSSFAKSLKEIERS